MEAIAKLLLHRIASTWVLRKHIPLGRVPSTALQHLLVDPSNRGITLDGLVHWVIDVLVRGRHSILILASLDLNGRAVDLVLTLDLTRSLAVALDLLVVQELSSECSHSGDLLAGIERLAIRETGCRILALLLTDIRLVHVPRRVESLLSAGRTFEHVFLALRLQHHLVLVLVLVGRWLFHVEKVLLSLVHSRGDFLIWLIQVVLWILARSVVLKVVVVLFRLGHHCCVCYAGLGYSSHLRSFVGAGFLLDEWGLVH